MFETLVWWVVVQVVGAVALPLTFLFFANLPDRGYAFSKPLGILLLSYALWLGGITHVLPNSRGSIVALLVVFLFASLLLFSRCRDDLASFVRRNRKVILIEEAVFLLAFLLWAVVRAYNPDIRTTEQPMDFAFVNAVYRSEFFPPHDPWLAGHAISYYYFGYLVMATLAKLSGIATSVAYNLSLSMLFGLVAAGAFSLAFNLAAYRGGVESDLYRVRTGDARVRGRGHDDPLPPRAGGTPALPGPGSAGVSPARGPVAVGLLGALFVVGIGNLEGVLEVLRAHQVGTPELWRWIGVKDAFQPYASPQWYPTENWWWWRATRVINTLVITLNPQGAVASVSDRDYTITEFPFFSFLLGDMHPHVMALPFGLLAIASSLNVLGQGKRLLLSLPRVAGDRSMSPPLIWQALGDWLGANGLRLGLAAVILGALGFLNSWDFPTQTLLFVASAAVGLFLVRRTFDLDLLLAVVAVLLVVALGGALLFSPFYVGFQSQASGVAPVLGPGTRFTHFAIVWGPFLLALAAFVAVLMGEMLSARRNMGGNRKAVPTPVVRHAETDAPRSRGFSRSVATRPADPSQGRTTPDEQNYCGGRLGHPFSWWPIVVPLLPVALWVLLVTGASASGFLKGESLNDFLVGRAIRLLPMFAAAAAVQLSLSAWLRRSVRRTGDKGEGAGTNDTGTVFALLLAAVGFALVLGCELFFIRDVFGTRMNTVFKFYYQAWVLLALASAYGLYYVSRRLLRDGWKSVGLIVVALAAVLLAGALVYPMASVFSKTNNFAGPPTLDGTAYVKRENPDEHQAVQWLWANAPDGAVVVESTGGQYTEYARVATRTGLPNVLGWAGHEWQWRGSDKAYVGRAEDIDTIYRSADRAQVLALLQKYGATYVYAGQLERSKYGQPALDRFAAFMDTVFKNETTAIYKVRR